MAVQYIKHKCSIKSTHYFKKLTFYKMVLHNFKNTIAGVIIIFLYKLQRQISSINN